MEVNASSSVVEGEGSGRSKSGSAGVIDFFDIFYLSQQYLISTAFSTFTE